MSIIKEDLYKQLEKLKNDEKYRIECMYLRAIHRIGENEYKYVDELFEKKIAYLVSSDVVWIKEMAEYYKELYKLYFDHKNGDSPAEQRQLQTLGAALFYFVNPYDFFPDFEHDRGYLDDLYVLTICLDQLRSVN